MKIGIMEHDGNVARAAGFTLIVHADDQRTEEQICEEIVYRCNLQTLRTCRGRRDNYNNHNQKNVVV